MWHCPSCGLRNISESEHTCPACGGPRKYVLTLTGTCGAITLRTGLVLGAKNLSEAIGEDAVFAASEQFDIRFAKGNWQIRSFEGARNETLLNAQPIPLEGSPLREGDQICIASRRDPSIRRGLITISFSN